ncbi:hypothetical protein G5V58_13035 [Nocardioides anomalus]|uniref:Uncharacterized protein n=1 Tax=Nocardioides anomalus TaxID=2712223 RepID=A0A6G6WE97_9ACTN|nr:hypothetical protein [Nocardioides anomalus]QIG43562.1 hypothetical protein G5V58_13035 [Nocardioides anomalus]
MTRVRTAALGTALRTALLPALLAMTLALAPGGSALAGPDHDRAGAQHEVTVLGPDSSAELATFTKAKCYQQSRRKRFSAVATSTDKAWRLIVVVPAFAGFDRDYDVPLADYAPGNPTIVFRSSDPNGPVWSSLDVPPFPVPGFGQVTFARKGKLMGVGFGPAMWNEGATSAVTLAGVLSCSYKKKHHH